MGHTQVSTTMIYMHVLNRGDKGALSPITLKLKNVSFYWAPRTELT